MRARDGFGPRPLSDELNRFATLVIGTAGGLSRILIPVELEVLTRLI